MPRKARIDAPGALHHIIIRGIERKAIFKGDFDRSDFLERADQILSTSSTPCYAWALLANHVHMLIRTGMVPLSTVMRCLLTGYALSFNRRHDRHGQLFQNRYKSILCQEDAYLLELTRYIHLNPLRAGIVRDIGSLDQYPYAGHAALMGKQVVNWQDTDTILGLFSVKKAVARRKYRDFVQKGMVLGRRPELVGGGIVRSVGGWRQAKKLTKEQKRIKGDERILGDSDFVLNVLARSNEQLERRYQLSAKGVDVAKLSEYTAGLFDLKPAQLFMPGRYPKVVQARSVLCYWAVRELGMTATDLARQIGMTQPAISISVKRGEKIVKKNGLSLAAVID